MSGIEAEEQEKLGAPRVPEALEDIVGGQKNLIPFDPGRRHLRVTFALWQNSMPSIAYPEFVRMHLDGQEVGYKEWTVHPISDDDLFIDIPVEKVFNVQGLRELHYEAHNWSGDPDNPIPSHSETITIDSFAPSLASPENQMNVPRDVLPPNKLTAYYLDQNQGRLSVVVPTYTTPAPGDHIEWFWGKSPSDRSMGGSIDLDDSNHNLPLQIHISRELIRESDDGRRYLSYRVTDRARNSSPYSDAVALDVDAKPIPRTLPWPAVEKASGTNEQQVLDPLQALSGVVVRIPEAAVVYPRERIRVQWGEPGSFGAFETEVPIGTDPWRFQVPMKPVAAHIGRTLTVKYFVVEENNNEIGSVQRRLQVQPIRTSNLPTVQCNGLTGGNLSYRTVAAGGAILKMAKWPLMSTDHWILMTVTGVGANGQDSPTTVLNKRAVTAAEVIGGIGQDNSVVVAKAFLNTLRRNASLTAKVYVSFDGGRTWPSMVAPNFPMLRLTFVD